MRRATNVLLSIIALALVVIAVNTMGPEAEAQPQVQQAPRIVGMVESGTFTIVRLWNTGELEYYRTTYGSHKIVCLVCDETEATGLWHFLGVVPMDGAVPTGIVASMNTQMFVSYSDGTVLRGAYLSRDMPPCPSNPDPSVTMCIFAPPAIWTVTEDAP